MALLLVGTRGEHIDPKKFKSVAQLADEYGGDTPHSLPLTVKCDGVVLTRSQTIPNGAVIMELIEETDDSGTTETVQPDSVPEPSSGKQAE